MTAELVLRTFGATDVGRRRKNNEDCVLVRDDLLLYAVADGAGGHAAGDVASRLATRSLENFFGATVRATHERPEVDRFGMASGARRLSAGVLKANRDVYQIAESSQPHQGMGTTIVAACFSPRSGLLHVANVGDSRCYRLRGAHLELLTQDHSLITDIIEQRPDAPDEVLEKLPRNVVTRALGVELELRVSLRSHTVVAGDKYLLCSDGLSNMVAADDLVETLSRNEPPEMTVTRLIAIANAAGGPDNIAALVIECAGGHERARPADSLPPPSDAPEPPAFRPDELTDPELLILGIEEIDLDPNNTPNEGLLLRKLGDLFTRRRS